MEGFLQRQSHILSFLITVLFGAGSVAGATARTPPDCVN